MGIWEGLRKIYEDFKNKRSSFNGFISDIR